LGYDISVVGRQPLTLNVNSIQDVVDANPGDGICATAGSNPVCTLRAAIQETNSFPTADTINVPVGAYILSLNGLDDSAAVGDLDITDPRG
jgi:CSLREA domain-containing protein